MPQPYDPTRPIYNHVPPGFTLDNYINSCPPVTGHILALMYRNGHTRVSLPCEVVIFNAEVKKAIVAAADGSPITVDNVEGPLDTRNVMFWGRSTDEATLHAEGHEPLADDYDFEESDHMIRLLLNPVTWGVYIPRGIGGSSRRRRGRGGSAGAQGSGRGGT